MANTLRNDDRALVGLLRAVENHMPGCPVEMAIKARDGAEKRFRGCLQSLSLTGMLFSAATPHHLPEIWDGDVITLWVGPSMYRLRGRIRPALGTDIVIEWLTAEDDGRPSTRMHPLGHAPVRPKPVMVTEPKPAMLAEPEPGKSAGNPQLPSDPREPKSVTSEPESRSSKVHRWLQKVGYTFIR